MSYKIENYNIEMNYFNQIIHILFIHQILLILMYDFFSLGQV